MINLKKKIQQGITCKSPNSQFLSTTLKGEKVVQCSKLTNMAGGDWTLCRPMNVKMGKKFVIE